MKVGQTIRVAIISPNVNKTDGGGHTFEASICNALNDFTLEDMEFKFFSTHYDPKKDKIYKPKKTVKKLLKNIIKRILRKLDLQIDDRNPWDIDNWLNNKILAEGCDLAYFVIPTYEALSIPFIVTHWDLGHRIWPTFPELSYYKAAWNKREVFYSHIMPRASYIVAGTKTGKGEIVKAYGLEEDKVIVNPFPVPTWLESTKEETPSLPDPNQKFFFYPAQFWTHKNHILILEALRILKERNLKPMVYFSGSDHGNQGYIEEKVLQYGLNDQIHFLGFVSEQELLWLYKNTEMLIYPSFLGPDNLPPLEALSVGARMAVADIPGARDYLKDYDVSYFSPIHEEELCSIMEEALSEKSIKPHRKDYSIPNASDYAKNIINIIRDLNHMRRCWGKEYPYKGK